LNLNKKKSLLIFVVKKCFFRHCQHTLSHHTFVKQMFLRFVLSENSGFSAIVTALPKTESYFTSGISLAFPAIAGECVTSKQHNFFAERVRDEDFHRRLPVTTLHEQNKKVP